MSIRFLLALSKLTRSDVVQLLAVAALLLLLVGVLTPPVEARQSIGGQPRLAPGTGGTSNDQSPGLRRRIILIPGVVFGCSVLSFYDGLSCDTGIPYEAVSRGQRFFGPIVRHLTASGRYDAADIHYVSYAVDWRDRDAYPGSATRQPLVASAHLLGEQIRHWGVRDVGYDVIAHSLGGALAAYWAATETDPSVLAAIHAIITLDSPVNGVLNLDGPATRLTPLAGAAGQDLRDAEVAATMRRSVEIVDVVTFGNALDRVVPVAAAVLDGACPPDLFDSCSFSLRSRSLHNHTEVLSDPEVLDRIDAVLAWDGQRR